MPETALPARVALKVPPDTARLARQLYTEGMPLADISRRTGLGIRTIYYWIDRVVANDGAVTLSPVPRRIETMTARQRRKGAGGRKPRGKAGARHGRDGHSGCAGASLTGEAETVVTGKSGRGANAAIVHASGTLKGECTPARRRQKPVRGPGGLPPRQRLLARLWRTAERQVAEIEGRMWAGMDADEQTARTAADSEKDARALALIARTLRELTAAEDDAARQTGMNTNDGSGRDLDDFRRELARRLERLRTDGEGSAAVSLEPE